MDATTPLPTSSRPSATPETVKRLHQVFDVTSESEKYPNRGKSRLVRVYVEVRL